MLYDIIKPINEDSFYENDERFLYSSHLNPYIFFEDIPKIEFENNNTESTGIKTKTIQQKDEGDEPELYTSKDILNIVNKESNKNKISEIFKTLNFREYIEEDLLLTKKKTRRENFDYNNFVYNNNSDLEKNKTNKKRGRQTNKLKKHEIHDKMSSDNIIKKVKSAIFNYILAFLNNIINFSDEYYYSLFKVKLLKLDYKFINRLKKDKESKILNMILKDIFSKDISPKYNKTKFPNDYNKKIIEKVLKIKDDETILFVFNMSLRDWLDIFTLKKSILDIINGYSNINITNIDFGKIEKSWVGIDKLLKEIKEKNGEYYLTHFIICLYNYERWFYMRKTRNYKKNEKEKKI